MNHAPNNNHSTRVLDDQEKMIVKALVRDPRLSDNQIGKLTGVPTPTVRRKRRKLEEESLLTYFAALDMQETGTGTFGARHLYIIKFRIGITLKQIVDEIKSEPNVRTIFTDLIYESHIAEIEGRIALVMIIEGKNSAGARCRRTIPRLLGETAKASEPFIRQVFIGATRAEGRHGVRAQALRHPQARLQRDPHLDHRRRRVLVRREPVLQDHRLQGHAAHRAAGAVLHRPADPAMETALALVHSRFSTNTFPSWDRAHPYRYIAHNGEINTLRGNINWMHARRRCSNPTCSARTSRRSCRSSIRTAAIRRCSTIASSCSCSGRSLPHAMMMMIPEPWSNHESMSDDKRPSTNITPA
jgi:DNA-binding Lrp family transcriptional regulator